MCNHDKRQSSVVKITLSAPSYDHEDISEVEVISLLNELRVLMHLHVGSCEVFAPQPADADSRGARYESGGL